MLKHGAELAGWLLLGTGMAAVAVPLWRTTYVPGPEVPSDYY